MESFISSSYENASHRILKYFTRIPCPTNYHYVKFVYKCYRCQSYLCQQCSNNSVFLTYTYQCQDCLRAYCIRHYTHHYHPTTISYWTQNVLTVYNPKFESHFSVNMNTHVNSYATSIEYAQHIYIMGGSYPSNDVYSMNTSSWQLSSLQPMLICKWAHSVCTSRDTIYSIGGHDNNPLCDCQQYKIKSNKWIQLPDLLSPRELCAAFAWNFYIYAYCGDDGACFLNTMERLSIFTKSMWERVVVKNSISPRQNMQAIQVSDGILLIGGFDGKVVLSDCIKLSIANDHSCVIMNSLCKGAEFICGPCGVYNGKEVFAFDFTKSLHILDRSGNWRMSEKI